MTSEGPPSTPPTSDDSEVLRRAASLVFVEDLERPELSEDDAHHLLHVLRLSPGAAVVASNGKDAWRPCRFDLALSDRFVGESERKRTRAKDGVRPSLQPIGEARKVIARPASVSVGFALQKGDRPELTVQKLTELGVDDISPFLSEHTVVRLDASGASRRGERLRRVAREAATQSRRVVLPKVSDPVPLAQLLAARGGPVYLAEPGGAGLFTGLTRLFVGPEGGWSKDELDLADGFVGLGEQVLRAETAAIVAGTLLVALAEGLVSPG